MSRWSMDLRSLWSSFILSPHNVLVPLSSKRCLPGSVDKPSRHVLPQPLLPHLIRWAASTKSPKITHLLSEQAVRQTNHRISIEPLPSPRSCFPAHLFLINLAICPAYWKAITGAIKEISQDSFSTSAAPLHCPFNCIHNRAKHLTHKHSLWHAHVVLNRTNKLTLKSFFIRQFYLL